MTRLRGSDRCVVLGQPLCELRNDAWTRLGLGLGLGLGVGVGIGLGLGLGRKLGLGLELCHNTGPAGAAYYLVPHTTD